MIRFRTIYYPSENVHLKKDVGQVPYMFHKLLGYDSGLVTYFNPLTPDDPTENIELHYPYIKKEARGLNLHFLGPRERGQFYEKPVIKYLVQNARQIDILHLFHFSIETIVYAMLYKLLNPKGILYVKLDIDINYFNSRPHFINTNTAFSYFKIKFFNLVVLPRFKKVVNLFSAETQLGLDMFKKRFKIPEEKIIKVRNGVDSEMLVKTVGHLYHYSQKENIIVTVGTLGLKQKNYTFLFNALNNVDLRDWRFYCIGKVEESFIREIEIFFSQNPDKRGKVLLTGEISDNNLLYEIYNKSKIVCQISEWEGFSISTCEALYFGNYPILSDSIGSIEELTDGFKFGRIVELNNEPQLTSVLQELIDNPKKLEDDFDNVTRYSRKHLVWQKIIPQLKEKLIK